MPEREHTRHAMSLTTVDGTVITFGPDELEAGSVPSSITFDTELPGGYGPANVSVPSPPGTRPGRWTLAATKIYDADTGLTLHEGRVTNVTKNDNVVALQIEGWAKHLFDDETAKMVFYDRDLSSWGAAHPGRKIFLHNAVPYETTDPTTVTDQTSPAVEMAISGHWEVKPAVEAWYDAGVGNEIAFVDYAWKLGTNGNPADTNWIWQVFAGTNDTLSGAADITTNLRAAGPGSGTLSTAGPERRYAGVQFIYNATPAGTDGIIFSLLWTLLAVVGNHGLTLQGSVAAPATGRGLLTSDMVSYIVGRWAPLLDFTTGVEGSIETTTFPVPHMVFREDTTAGAMLEAMVLFGGSEDYVLEWGVYEDRRLIVKQSPKFGRTWRVRSDQTAKASDQGQDASERLNGVKVAYDDGTGTKLSIGPPGSGSTVETSDLADPNPSNPANQDGARHWKVYDAGVMNEAQAKLVGGLILTEANNLQWRGDVTVTDWVTDESGAKFPAGIIRAGDFVVVEDDPDGDTAPRQIRNTKYDGTKRSVNCSVGASPDRLDILLAKAGVTLAGRM